MAQPMAVAAALATLDASERERVVVYLDESFVEAGGVLPVDGEEKQIPAGTAVAFVDLEPGVNWGHRCRYLFIDTATMEVDARDAQFPPFLTADVPGMRAVHVGPAAPGWAVHEGTR